MKFKERTNKIISFVLAVVMILSAFTPAFTEVANAASYTYFSTIAKENIEGSVTYSDSGQIVENPETGTDLDNFKIDLNFGTIDSAIDGDTLSVIDQRIQIPVVINIEYTGATPYNAESITMVLGQTLNGMNRNPSLLSDYTVFGDVGAELKGSGSGRGDWYYTQTAQNNNEGASILTFTNKSDTVGAFTSSIEVILIMPGIRYVKNEFSGAVNLELKVDGLAGTKISKTLTVNTKTTHDEYQLNQIVPSKYSYTSYGTPENIGKYNGKYSLNEYYIMRVDFESMGIDKNRGSVFHSLITLPDDIIVSTRTIPTEFTSTYEDYLSFKTGSYSTSGDYKYSEDNAYMILVIPKDKYQAGDKFTIRWDADAVFLDTNETWNQSLEIEAEVLETTITYKPASISVNKGSQTLYRYAVNRDEGKDFEWEVRPPVNNAFLANRTVEDYLPVKAVLEDNIDGFYRNYNNSIHFYRDPLEDELYLKYIKIREYFNRSLEYGSDNEVLFNIYVKKANDTEYTFIKQVSSTEFSVGAGNKNGSSYIVELDETQRYLHYKIEITGRYLDVCNGAPQSAFSFAGGYHIQIDPETEPYLNNENNTLSVYNRLNVTEEWLNGITLSGSDIGKLTFKEASMNPEVTSFSASTYSLKNSRIYYNINAIFAQKLNADFSDLMNFKATEYKGEITIPSYFEFDIKDIHSFNFRFYDSSIYNEATGETIKPSDANNMKDKLIDYEESSYEIIINNNGTKTLKVKFKLNDGYYNIPYQTSNTIRSSLNFQMKTDIYMDLDTYSGLLYLGKLPSSATVAGKEYKTNEGIYSTITGSEYETSSKNITLPSLAGSTFEGIEKLVNTNSGYSKDLQIIKADGTYSYKLRLAGGQTLLDNIVFYDNLEEAYGENEYWKGTFTGLDTTLLDMYYEGEDYTYTVYYSADKNQAFDLTADGWVKSEDWTEDLANVKSVAIDLGPDFRLPTKSIVYVIINMKAPSNCKVGTKTYNSYAVDYKAYDTTTGALMEDIKTLPSNITEVILSKPINITVNKIWAGADPVTDSINISLMADGIEVKTAVLTKENNWSYTFKNIDSVSSTGAVISYSVAEINKFQRFETTYSSTTDADDNKILTITNTRIPDDTYHFEKEWITEGKEEIKLNLIEDSDLSLEEQKTLIANKTLSITASGEGLNNITFEVVADNDGVITIPVNYSDYTDFNFSLKYNNKTYIFNYKVDYCAPETPENIKLNSSNGEEIIITAENDWKATYKFEDYNILFAEESVNNWDTGNIPNGLTITFDEKFESYNSYYGYLYIYYYYNGSLYRSPKYYSTSSSYTLAGKTINIPSTEVWFYWYGGSNSQANKYGFKVTDIKNANIEKHLSGVTKVSSLPSGTTAIDLAYSQLPETTHNPYNTGYVLWHYTQPDLTDNITVTKTGDYEYNVKIVNTAKQVANIVSSDIEIQKIDFNVNKDWTLIDTNSITLGYNASSGLAADEYKAIIAGKTLSITAIGNGIETKTFDVIATAEGLISIPDEYKAYTDFAFEIEYNNKVYRFSYKVNRVEPTKPDSIVIVPSVPGFDMNGNEITEFTLTEANNWTTTVKFTDPTVTFTEKDVADWTGEINITQNGDVYTVSIVNTGAYFYTSDITLNYKKFDYNFEKEWSFKDAAFTIGYLESSGLTVDKYNAIVAGKTLNITAKGEGLETQKFEVVADENGNIVIPAEYASYTSFEFSAADDILYQFTYNVSKSEPELPEQIKLNSSNGDTITINKSDNWTATFVSEIMNLQFTEVLEDTGLFTDYEVETSVVKTDNGDFNVKVVNTGKYVYTSTVIVETNKDITITKEWIIPEDFIKLNIKDVLGYEGNYDKVEILKDKAVLETIVRPDESGLLVSVNKYAITESYVVKIYMTDGTTKTATVNENKFEVVPVEIELFDKETSLGVFELNEESDWQVTVSVPAGAEITVKEITTGNWAYEVIDTVVKNTVNQEIEITDITVPAPGEVIDTGNEAFPTYLLSIFFVGLAGLATSLLLSRKKKNR